MKKGCYKDISGNVYGRVKVLSFDRIKKNYGALFNCICECGTRFITRSTYLLSGHTKSCGCLWTELSLKGRPIHGLYKTPEYKLWKEAKYRARHKGRDFNIDIVDIKIPKYCPVLGLRLEAGKDRLQINSPSLDCFDPDKGYVKGNVWVISYRANTIKSDLSLDDLRKFVKALESFGGDDGTNNK